jgi:hypothetical protein
MLDLMRKRVGVTLLLCVVLLHHATALGAQDTQRLQLYLSLGHPNNMTKPNLKVLGPSLRSLGYQTDKKGQGDLSFTLSPKIVYDSNVNGGFPGDGFTVFGFRFNIDEEYQAKSAPQIGVSAVVTGFARYGKGKIVEITGELDSLHNREFSVRRSAVSLCSKNDIGSWTFVDICASGRSTEKQLSSSDEEVISLKWSKILPVEKGALNIGARIQSEIGNANDSNVELNYVFRQFDSTETAVRFGSLASGDAKNNWNLQLSHTFYTFGRFVALQASFAESTGSPFFGNSRKDQYRSIAVKFPLGDKMVIGFGYEDNRSTIDLFSSASPTASIELRALRF